MKSKLFKRLAALALTVAMTLSVTPAALAEGTEGDASTATVTLDQTTLSLTVGGTAKLTATVKDADGNVVDDPTVVYASGNTAVATVDPDTGKITAVKEGDATITASYREGSDILASATCAVTVTAADPSGPSGPVAVTSVVVKVNDDSLAPGDTTKATATVSPYNATDSAVTWASSDSTVVSVDADGVLTAVSAGKAYITATAGGVPSEGVAVEVAGIVLSKSTLELTVGQSENLSYNRYGSVSATAVEWSTSNPSVAGVNGGRISAYFAGTATITAAVGNYKATVTVTVKEDTADAIPASMTVGEVLFFADLLDTLKGRANSKVGAALEYITNLSVATSAGILHYNYISPDAPGSGVGSSERYYVDAGNTQRSLSDLAFVPRADFGGTAVISYKGYCGNGQSFTGTIRVTVENSGDVGYNTAEGRLLEFETADFAAVCANKIGGSLQYVTFTLPSSGKGTLYYNYSSSGQYSRKVSSGTKYYITGSSLKLENVSFLPADGYTGTVTIPYTGTNSSGTSYSGNITITVFASGDSGSTDIVYESSGTAPVSFAVTDFNAACVSALGSELNYVYFDLPDPSDGALYYNYTSASSYGGKVSAGTRYFRSATPYLSYVDFVPAGSTSGTVVIAYTGYAVSGDQFTGRVRIVLEEGGDAAIAYTTGAGRAVTFDGLDFNEACQSANGASLSYISFVLPDSSAGTLYYNYNSSFGGTRVTAASTYTTATLSGVTFVPAGGYTGTVEIYFSGYDNAGSRFGGSVRVTVSGSGAGDVVRYTVIEGGRVDFDAGDFNAVSRQLTGDDLSYVRFTLPSSNYGRLYYHYNENSGTGAAVTASSGYYHTGGAYLLSGVSFVPRDGYTGAVEIAYTGLSTGGASFTGTIAITVTEPRMSAVTYQGSALPVYLSAADIRDACSAALPKALSHIYFDALPSSVYGRLMVNYTGAGTGTEASANTNYYSSGMPAIDSLCFIAKAGYTGAVTISYTAVDAGGSSMSGAIRIYISDGDLDGYFTDLGNYGWAAPSIEFLRNAGVTGGYGGGIYGPGDSVTRAQFVTMLCRLFDFDHKYTANFSDVASGAYYYQTVMTARALGIVNGDGENFDPDGPLTRQEAVVMLQRAMSAAGMTVSPAAVSLLDTYSDGGQVAGYAQSAMASMVRMGVINGDSGRLDPTNTVTRAEMAVMLHRVATL